VKKKKKKKKKTNMWCGESFNFSLSFVSFVSYGKLNSFVIIGLVIIYTFWALVKTGVEMGGFPSIDDFIHP
jgi:hypothetical protein